MTKLFKLLSLFIIYYNYANINVFYLLFYMYNNKMCFGIYICNYIQNYVIK